MLICLFYIFYGFSSQNFFLVNIVEVANEYKKCY